MTDRDYRDISGGALLMVLGLLVAAYAAHKYEMGSLVRMGPGLFPQVLGYLLAAVGALILVPAIFRRGPRVDFCFRPFVACLAAVLVFALVIERVGLVPTTVLLVWLATRADRKLSALAGFLFALALTTIGALIFSYGLGVTLPLFRWQL